MDRGERINRLRNMLHQIAEGGDLESMVREQPRGLEGLESFQPSVIDEDQEHAHRAVQKVAHDETLSESEIHALEAIVLPRERPVVFIRSNSYGSLPAPWSHYSSRDIRLNLETSIPSVGRIELPNSPWIPYGGTGFVVGNNLLMTNRHVAELFASGLGTEGLAFRPGQTAAIDFKREVDSDASINLRIQKIVMIHPYWDMALLQVDGFPTGHPVLTLSILPPEEVNGHEIGVVGYPGRDDRNDLQLQDQIFERQYNVKRLHPGLLRSCETIDSFGNSVRAMTHDSSTLGGNSGSAVIDVATGQVIGLHFAGVYLKANYCVPTYELARDSRVVDAGVKFAGAVDTQNEWLAAWRIADVGEVAVSDLGKATCPPPALAGAPMPVSPRRPRQPAVARATGSRRPLKSMQPACSAAVWTIPLTVTINLGDLAAPAAPPLGGTPQPSGSDEPDEADRKEAIEAFERGAERPYYDEAADEADREEYYSGIDSTLDPAELYDALSALVTETHHNRPSYKPSVRVYPWVDLQPNRKLKSVYSGRTFEALELIEADLEIANLRRERVERFRESPAAESPIAEAAFLEALEAQLPFNCEHVVPQSWFGKHEPMRGDIHHLFACETGCNSFRGNIPYFEFANFREAVRSACGKRETNKFEPEEGKGAVARATLYFLLRYPGEINATSQEYTEDGLETLLAWHNDHSVSRYELHRNQAIFAVQGNRNPLIDHPEWAASLDFVRGLG